jgi:hypothetical protein
MSAKKSQREVNGLSSREKRGLENGWTGGRHNKIARETYDITLTEKEIFQFLQKVRADGIGKRNWSQS